MDYMTTKQIADTAGVTTEAVRQAGKKFYPHKMVKGKQTKWTRDECEVLLKYIRKKNFVGEAPSGLEETSKQLASGDLGQLISEAVGQALAPILGEMRGRIQALEEKAEEKQPLLPPPVDPRSELNRIIRKYSSDNGNPYAWVWTSLYKEYRDRYHVDIPLRAKNIGMSPMEYAEAEDLMLQLVGLARHLYGGAA